MITRNPNYGGASGLGTWTLEALELAPLEQTLSADVVARLRAWARTVVAEATPPFSKQAREVLQEPVEQALVAVLAALRSEDLAALKAARALAPVTLDALTSSTLSAVVHGHARFPEAVALTGPLEALLARWRALP